MSLAESCGCAATRANAELRLAKEVNRECGTEAANRRGLQC
jgi:hypothetical protein